MGLLALSLVAAISTMGPLFVGAPAVHGALPAAQDTVSDLYERVGDGPHARLRFFFEVTFLKIDIAWVGGGAGRFIGATRDNFQAAVECGSMSQATFDAMWPVVEELLAPVDERGMEKGDAIHYRIEGPRVEIVYVEPSGEVIVDGSYESPEAGGGSWDRSSAGKQRLARS